MTKGAKVGISLRLKTLDGWFKSLPSQVKQKAAADKAIAALRRNKV